MLFLLLGLIVCAVAVAYGKDPHHVSLWFNKKFDALMDREDVGKMIVSYRALPREFGLALMRLSRIALLAIYPVAVFLFIILPSVVNTVLVFGLAYPWYDMACKIDLK